MSTAFEMMKLIFVVLDVSFNSGHYTVVIKRQLCTLIFAVFFYHVYLHALISTQDLKSLALVVPEI